MKKCFSWGKYLQAAIAWLIFFALVGKPLSSLADPSTQVGFGSIPYSGLWTNGSQAGSGFGQWEFSQTTNGNNVFFYVNDSRQTDNGSVPGNGSNDINTAGVAWGMTAGNGALACATRPFSSSLSSGQVFQIDMDNGYITTNASVGFALQNTTSSTFSPSANSVFEFYFSGGSNNYTINAATVNGTPPTPFGNIGMHLTFTLTSTNTYSLSVLQYPHGGAAGAGTTYNYTGNLLNPSAGQSIKSVRLFNYQAGFSSNFNAYFNNLNVISNGVAVAADSASNTTYNTTGTTFRVWAPNATTVNVWGQFNFYSTNATPLYSEGNGNWSADVAGALNGQQYKYYIVNSTVGTNLFKQDPRSRKVASATGNSYIYNTASFNWEGDNFAAPGLGNTVIYELNIGSFNDPNAPDYPGTFYTATNTLPYLAWLGVSAIEVMPVNQFPCCISEGYNPANPFAVDNDAYGGPDGFKTFVRAAHQNGMAVILDTVQNHYGGSDYPDYGDLTNSLWQFDGSYSMIPGTNIEGGGIYFYQGSYDEAFAWCCSPWGPRPDYDTAQVSQYITDNFTMFLSEYHVDGFRWDSPGEIVGDWPGNDTLTSGENLVTGIGGMIHSQATSKINIGEDQNQFSGTYGFDATWNDNYFYDQVEPQLAAALDSGRSMAAISNAVWMNFNQPYSGSGSPGNTLPGWGSVFFLEDHDISGNANGSGDQRLPVKIDPDDPLGKYARKRSMLGSAITLTTAGIPMLLQGEEMLTTNQFGPNVPIDWSYTNTWNGVVQYYRDLIRLRRNLDGRSSGLTGEASTIIWEDNRTNYPMIAYHRWSTGNAGDDVVVICNFSNTYWPGYFITTNSYQLGFPKNGAWYVQLNSDWSKYCSDYDDYGDSGSITVSGGGGTISIAPYSVLVLSQNIPAAPPTPQNLRVTTVSTNQITIGWSVSSSATGYIVAYTNGTVLATIDTNSYTDTGLAIGNTYCYQVTATNNSGGVSGTASNACGTTLPATGDTNLLAYWTFDEGTGTTANDSSGNGNTGTVVTGAPPTWISGIISNALSFDGESTQVTVPNSATLNPVNGITIAAWVNDQSGGWYDTERILEKGETDNQYALFAASTSQLEFLLAGVTNITAATPSTGVWHHLAGTYDVASSLISLYIDGQLATQQVTSGAMPVTTDPLAIGNLPGNSLLTSNFFQGYIDDVQIYGSALSAAQISQLYNTNSVADGIPNWWRMLWFGSGSSTNAAACTACCAGCDADGTGQNNFFKYVAGLNPTDPTQVFTVQIAASNQVINLTYSPVYTNVNYTVQSSPDLNPLNFSNLTNVTATPPPINGGSVTVTDLQPWPSNEFYHVLISLPPSQ
ncbi:MAG: LamG-like jellyroll fold domain-containing protein [Verrucomicrobiia bacterium]